LHYGLNIFRIDMLGKSCSSTDLGFRAWTRVEVDSHSLPVIEYCNINKFSGNWPPACICFWNNHINKSSQIQTDNSIIHMCILIRSVNNSAETINIWRKCHKATIRFCRTVSDKYWLNAQYCVNVKTPERSVLSSKSKTSQGAPRAVPSSLNGATSAAASVGTDSGPCTMIISLMQKNNRRNRTVNRVQSAEVAMSFDLYKVYHRILGRRSTNI